MIVKKKNNWILDFFSSGKKFIFDDSQEYTMVKFYYDLSCRNYCRIKVVYSGKYYIYSKPITVSKYNIHRFRLIE